MAGIADDVPLPEVMGEPKGKLLVVGWGSTHGAITMAVERLQAKGKSVSYIHLRHINPLPNGLGELLTPKGDGVGMVELILVSRLLMCLRLWQDQEQLI